MAGALAGATVFAGAADFGAGLVDLATALAIGALGAMALGALAALGAGAFAGAAGLADLLGAALAGGAVLPLSLLEAASFGIAPLLGFAISALAGLDEPSLRISWSRFIER